MARTTVSPQNINVAGAALTMTDGIADGHQFKFSRNVKLLVYNSHGSETLTLTVQSNYSRAGATLPDKTHTITNGQYFVIESFDEASIQSDGNVYIDYSGLTTVSDAKIALWE